MAPLPKSSDNSAGRRLHALRHNCSSEYQISREAIGRRSLKNTCLAYLCSAGEDAAVKMAESQFTTTDNMTDTMAALLALNDVPCIERNRALESFYSTWKNENLVVDKWLALHASSRLPDTIDHVIEMTKHESFNLKNPNRVRALIGAFAHGNPVRFHDGSGRGYRFVGEYVAMLDEHVFP